MHYQLSAKRFRKAVLGEFGKPPEAVEVTVVDTHVVTTHDEVYGSFSEVRALIINEYGRLESIDLSDVHDVSVK